MTVAASAHVRTALGDKAFDEAASRGLALTLGSFHTPGMTASGAKRTVTEPVGLGMADHRSATSLWAIERYSNTALGGTCILDGLLADLR